jgi:hypothetical protein
MAHGEIPDILVVVALICIPDNVSADLMVLGRHGRALVDNNAALVPGVSNVIMCRNIRSQRNIAGQSEYGFG